MKKALSFIADGIAFLVVMDLAILVTALLQIGLEGKTGVWADFWRVQAEFLLRFL